MDKALLKLLEKKDFEYITIKEICKEADVNRSTFYLHYENTNDLLKETSDYIIDNFLSYFSVKRSKIAIDYQNSKLEDLLFITPEYLNPYLTYVKENQRIFKTCLKHLNSLNFNTMYNDMFQGIFSPLLARFNLPEKERKYVLKFYLTGIIAVVTEWLNNRCEDSIEDISKIIIQCVAGQAKIYDNN
jgi:AcrR family transcriptional regulator